MHKSIVEHFKQPAGIPAVALCSGVLTAWCAAVFVTHVPSHQLIVWSLGAFTALPSTLYLGWRILVPFRGKDMPSGCAVCHRSVATSPVRYLQVTGAVVLMSIRELPLFLCRRCSFSAFHTMTLHTLVLGWWSLTSAFVVPGFLVNNLLFLIRSQLGAQDRR